jgi:DNA-binding transcriptional LysR family regulator
LAWRHLLQEQYLTRNPGRVGSPPEPAEDLMQVGYVGLMKAIGNFDPAVGASLATYARPCFRDERWQVHVKRPVRELVLELREATWRLAQQAALGYLRSRLLDLEGTRASTGVPASGPGRRAFPRSGAWSRRGENDEPDTGLVAGMELRQLRYFVTLAGELHFGRAAEREHIVQSALSQQVQRLERELGVRLLERSTHHVSLTAAGEVFLVEARQILAHVDRAAAIARRATGAAAPLRVGIIDASYDSMPQILHEVQACYPGLVIHQVEASVPEQYQQLTAGRLDVGIGRAALAPPQVASLLFRQDPLGVLVPSGHRFAGLDSIPVAVLAEEPLLLAEEVQAPEFNQFTVELCRAAGFTPTVYGGTVESIRAAADLVAQGRCLYCVPSSCIAALPGTIWRPLTEPASYYPWSVLWRATETSDHVRAVVSCTRAMSQRLGWLATAGQSAH